MKRVFVLLGIIGAASLLWASANKNLLTTSLPMSTSVTTSVSVPVPTIDVPQNINTGASVVPASTSKSSLPKPYPEAIIYEDNFLYACLANFPITKGHTVVVWKKDITDLHLLTKKEYEYLMNKVEAVRSSMLKTLGVEKVYLVYMDEAKHVHWHLVPRYIEQGYNVFLHKPKELKDFSLAPKIKKNLVFEL